MTASDDKLAASVEADCAAVDDQIKYHAMTIGAVAPVVAHCRSLLAERDKLKAFKVYVHARLDAAGVPADPDSPHKAEGCRIGGRLDAVFGERDAIAMAALGRSDNVADLPAVVKAIADERHEAQTEIARLRAVLRPLVKVYEHAARYARFKCPDDAAAAYRVYMAARELLAAPGEPKAGEG